MHLFSTRLQPSITVLHLKQRSPCCRWDGFSGFLSVSVLNDASSACFELRGVFGRVGFVSVGFSAEKQNMVALLFCPSQRALPLVVTVTKSVICCWSGASSVYVTSLFTLVSVVELNTLSSRPPLFFPALGFPAHPGQKRSFHQTREQQEILPYCTETTACKNSHFRTDFAFCHAVPLRHSSCQTGGNDCWF